MASSKKKSTKNKRDFIALLASMSDNEINDYIKAHGKGPKKVRMIIHVNPDNKK